MNHTEIFALNPYDDTKSQIMSSYGLHVRMRLACGVYMIACVNAKYLHGGKLKKITQKRTCVPPNCRYAPDGECGELNGPLSGERKLFTFEEHLQA